MSRKHRKTKDINPKTFQVSWSEWHNATVEATSREDVYNRFWELIEQLGDEHPHLTFDDWEINKGQKLNEP